MHSQLQCMFFSERETAKIYEDSAVCKHEEEAEEFNKNVKLNYFN